MSDPAKRRRLPDARRAHPPATAARTAVEQHADLPVLHVPLRDERGVRAGDPVRRPRVRLLARLRQPDGRRVPVRDGRPGGDRVRDGLRLRHGRHLVAVPHGRRGRARASWRERRSTGGRSRSCGTSCPGSASRQPSSTRRISTRCTMRCPEPTSSTARRSSTRRRRCPIWRHLAGLCREAGVVSAVDNTFASPYLCNPVTLGFDVAIHSATKYIGGHADLIGGVACTNEDLFRRLRDTVIDLGGTMQPLEAWLCLRGLATLSLRMQHHCASAGRLAAALAAHPSVEHVLLSGSRDPSAACARVSTAARLRRHPRLRGERRARSGQPRRGGAGDRMDRGEPRERHDVGGAPRIHDAPAGRPRGAGGRRASAMGSCVSPSGWRMPDDLIEDFTRALEKA